MTMRSWCRVLVLLACAVLATACLRDATGDPDDSLHVEVVCGAASAETRWGCTAEERRESLERWAQRDLPPSGSTFTLWGTGGRPDGPVRLLSTCVPAGWGANPL